MNVSCFHVREKADLLLVNGLIYTLGDSMPVAGAMALREGRILAVGTPEDLLGRYVAADTADLQGRVVYPGFIDAHCHFYGYAINLQYIDLFGCRSFDEVLERISRTPAVDGKWLAGRGWDHTLWPDKQFPDNAKLNALYPSTPVVLTRVDGHVVLANQAALTAAGIGPDHRFGPGQVLMKNGILTGILKEQAADRMRSAIPLPDGEAIDRLLERAERDCFAAGLTGVGDAGLEYDELMRIDTLQKQGRLSLHVYAMLPPSPENIREIIMKGGLQSDKLSARAVKIYADGTLGSRTALLKKPYADAAGQTGILVTSPDSVRAICKMALENGLQVNTHCIGDSAVAMILRIYAGFLKGPNDLRWRIEHAQIVDPADLHYFAEYSIVPSVQATHATSDMRWAADRLGGERVKNAYAYKSLMQQNGWIPNGTDFPIEAIYPLHTFYAAVARQDLQGNPEGGFQPENALSRDEALKSITLWAARANFTENSKGSLEPGKDADFVVLERDILTIPLREIPSVRVMATWVGGRKVYEVK